MSVGDSFTLVPLSNFFVKKSTLPGTETNLGSIHPIASGRIEVDGLDNIGGVSGNYTWYRLSHFEGATGTQGKELREYLLVCRSVSTTGNGGSVKLYIPDGGFNPNYMTFISLYPSMQVTHPGAPGTMTWNFSVTGNFDVVQLSSSSTFPANGQSFFFYVMGI
jgi:hypothetical protein